MGSTTFKSQMAKNDNKEYQQEELDLYLNCLIYCDLE